MDRLRNPIYPGRYDVLRSVAAPYRDIARLEPTRAGGVQSRQAGFLDTPGSFGVAACPTVRSDENHVARSNLDVDLDRAGQLPITS